jgi:hypothetical protein
MSSTTAVQIPFPAGQTAVNLAGTVVNGIVMTPVVPGALLSIQAAADQTGATDYRPVISAGKPLVIPVGSGGYFPLPQDVGKLPDKIQLVLTNFGQSTVTINLITS